MKLRSLPLVRWILGRPAPPAWVRGLSPAQRRVLARNLRRIMEVNKDGEFNPGAPQR
ncbi:MAG: hypothetical protein ACYTGN_02260 [Planctomycetota bacterium]|jgi:hypothetical protein